MKEEAPAFLTVTSLQLPDSPIPLIDSQAIARSCRSRDSSGSHDDKDDIMDELLRKVVAVRTRTEGQKSKRNKVTVSPKCAREFSNLEEQTRRIIEGPKLPKGRATRSGRLAADRTERECIFSEVSEEKLRINIGKKTKVRRSSRSESPEVTHVIRIAMKYNGQQDCKEENREGETKEAAGATDEPSKQTDGGCCPGVSVALDFTLNCSSLQLTSRDVSVKPNKAKVPSTHLEQPIQDGA